MTVIDATVAHDRSTVPAIATQPTSLVAVEDQCARLEAWAETCDSVMALRDAGNKLAAIDEYLRLTSTEGRAAVARTQRRLEVRIGKVLGPAQPNGKTPGSCASDPSDLTPNQRSEFRAMAEHEDVVEDVIANSTDEAPASRRRVTDAIKDKPVPAKPRRSPLPEQARRAGWDLRKAVERIERILADDRFQPNAGAIVIPLDAHVADALTSLIEMTCLFSDIALAEQARTRNTPSSPERAAE